jgi:hypothetical protein
LRILVLGVFDAAVLGEKKMYVFLFDAGAVVCHTELKQLLLPIIGTLQLDFAVLIAEFNRILQNIQQDLRSALPVSLNPSDSPKICNVEREPDILRFQVEIFQVDDFLKELGRVERLGNLSELAVVQLSAVQGGHHIEQEELRPDFD